MFGSGIRWSRLGGRLGSRHTARPVLQRLSYVVHTDDVGAFQVGDGQGHLQHAVKGSCREVQLVHRCLEQALGGLLYLAEVPHLPRAHLRVGFKRRRVEAFSLALTGALHSWADEG